MSGPLEMAWVCGSTSYFDDRCFRQAESDKRLRFLVNLIINLVSDAAALLSDGLKLRLVMLNFTKNLRWPYNKTLYSKLTENQKKLKNKKR